MPDERFQSTNAYTDHHQNPESGPSINLDRARQISFAQSTATTIPPIWILLLLPLLPIIPVLLIIQLATAGSGEGGISKFLVGFELGLLAVGVIAFLAIRRLRRTDLPMVELNTMEQENDRSLRSLRRGNEAVRMQLARRADS
ncbi:uncharacterized protein BDZ99DRAFT_11958 [Mytilinidion resinicola]|uniref:Uncharacterized protein n=1 Tax=Mytilinidion resinicola TaxID=574789 RepID=A0A6A6Z812_9PEZI|nr:uncharacterized protein BDZ99DRAFT_11958 [Mytilinidion resinicola]KAF2817252.1 hypothetical protein BDZ99DRAFT_11958 [Mytilinidion resinicola]